MELCFLLDPLESLSGPLRPAFLTAKEMKTFRTVFTSQFVDEKIAEILKISGFEVLDLGKYFYFSGSMLNMEAWLRKSEFKPKDANRLIVNFSQCFTANAHIYYAQGPMTKALSDMYPEMKRTHKLAYRFAGRFFNKLDKSFIKNLRANSELFIANSRFCASMYESMGIQVDGVIYPPLDCTQFTPVSEPSEDYVVTYFGKETKYNVVKNIADSGVKLKAFGAKEPYLPSWIRKHPNIQFEGNVSDQRLVDLYANALYTLFTFNHEPFGYIPVESMACGTPVLTYNAQGPSESVVEGQTGWLTESNRELENTAVQIWKHRYSPNVRKNCRLRALNFDARVIAKEWFEVIKAVEMQKMTRMPYNFSDGLINIPSVLA
jgi:glycosyltransferase involved in cell wall biosynthesis